MPTNTIYRNLNGETLKVIVSTCKSYSAVLEIWKRAANCHWPHSLSNLLICTDREPDRFDPNEELFVHGSGWCAGLVKCLESLEDDLVVLVLDDYILEKPIEKDLIGKLQIEMQNDPSIGVVYLTDIGLRSENTERTGLFEIKNGPYSINSCPGLWRRKFLIDTLKPFKDPWAWEAFAFGTSKARSFRTMCWGPTIYNYSYKTGGLIYRGEISRNALATLKEQSDFSVCLKDLGEFNIEVENEKKKRSWDWKLRFLITGFSISTFTAWKFISFSIGKKISKLKSKH